MPAALCGVGLALFASWRTVAGVCVAFAGLLAAAAVVLAQGASLGALPAGTLAMALLEPFGWLTIVLVARERDPRRVSRRLLGAWLSTSGLATLGVALCCSGVLREGSALVVGALACKLGVVPAYAWAPMLLRHPSGRIKLCGGLATVLAGAALVRTLPDLPDVSAAALMLRTLGIITAPWAAWFAWRQRAADPACSRTYVFVSFVAAAMTAYSFS